MTGTKDLVQIMTRALSKVKTRQKAARSDIETLITHPFWKGKIKDENSDSSKTSKPILSESINIKNSLMEPNHLKSSFRKMFDFIFQRNQIFEFASRTAIIESISSFSSGGTFSGLGIFPI